MSKSSTRHPVRKILVVTAIVGALLALRNAGANKGGSYDPSSSGTV